MKLLTKSIENRFAKIGSQDGKNDAAIVVAKYFTPFSNWTWYATEYNPETGLFFGLACGGEMELGYFSLAEFEDMNSGLLNQIERDLYFDETTMEEVRGIEARLRGR